MTDKDRLPPRAVVTEVRAECVNCGRHRWIGPDEIPEGEMPSCHHCGSLMVATRTETRQA